MEDSATLESDMSAMMVFGEAVFPHCLFSAGSLPPGNKSAKLPGNGAEPRRFLQTYLTGSTH